MSKSDLLPAVVPAGELAEFTDENLVREYLDSLKESTRGNYRKNLWYFAQHVGATSPAAAVTILVGQGAAHANRIALRYRTAMRTAGLASATINSRLAALRSVVSALQAAGRIEWTLHVKNFKVTKYRDTRGPGNDGWDSMRAIAKDDADRQTPKSVRDRAMLRVDHDLGLRVAELLGMDMTDIELKGELPSGVWLLRKGKTELELFEFPEETMNALAAWLVIRGDAPGPVFVRLDRAAKSPTRLTSNAFWKIVDKLGRRAGIARQMSPHRLRHHAITLVLERNNGNVVEGQAFSGHADLRTLSHYIDNAKNTKGKMAKLIADPD